MKVVIAGSTGMVGGLVLKHCLDSDDITEVISLVRKNTKLGHPKLKEVIVEDFENYSAYDNIFQGVSSTFFCVGVYTGQVADELFKKITVDYAVKFAATLKQNSPSATLCLLSGAGADRTEKSRTAFARYKGMAENQIQELGLRFYSFRPGFIYPVEPRAEPNLMYRVMRKLYPLIRMFGKNASIKSTELSSAMFNVARKGASKEILENSDILEYV